MNAFETRRISSRTCAALIDLPLRLIRPSRNLCAKTLSMGTLSVISVRKGSLIPRSRRKGIHTLLKTDSVAAARSLETACLAFCAAALRSW